MTNENRTLSEREECEALLPWYVTGRLSKAEAAQVEAYLARHPEMRRQLELVGEDRVAAIKANQDLVAPKGLTADRLLARLPQRSSYRLSTFAIAPLNAIANFFAAPSPAGVRWAAVAALAILLGQAAVIGTLLRSGADDTYQTASGGAVSAVGTTVLVRFQAAASMELVSAELAKRGMRIVDGPKPGQLYVVAIGPAGISPAARGAREQELRQLTGLVANILTMGP